MNSLKISARRAGSVFAAAALVLATALPGLASAATVTERSIALSSSSADASGVNYTINFTATQDAGAVLVEFCGNSPLLGESCSTPGGFSLSSATVGGGFTKDGTNSTATKLIATGTIDVSANDEVSIPVTGVHNPTASGPLYARILTYATDATGYTSANPDAGDDHLDDGSVAISITPTIGVSAAVLESMIFCVSGAAITENCGGVTAPSLKLGNDDGNGVIALSPTPSEGQIYTQISTNAVSGAVVSLKSNTVGCGGLVRAGATSNAAGCGIAPALALGVGTGSGKFGVKTATAAGVGSNFAGALQAYDPDGAGPTTPYYNSSDFKLLWVSGDGSGVTGPYGDPLLDTAGAPVNNMGMALTFAAASANNTPAGNYSADLSLVATGKF